MRYYFLLLAVSFTNLVFSQTTQIQYLSGKGSEDAIEWEFYCSEGRRSGEWTTIRVPSCWELEGFGTFNYGHDEDAIRGKEIGTYRKKFLVPEAWKGSKIFIVFEGSMTDTHLSVNGKSAGEIHQGAFYEFQYEISRLLKYGKENIIEVEVKKESSDKSVNAAERHADYWIFGGIFRPVYLMVKPEEHITRIAVNAQSDGNFKMDVFLSENKRANKIDVVLYDLKGNQIGNSQSTDFTLGSNQVTVNGQFDNVKSWNPEYPNLYIVETRLMNNLEVLHVHKERIGFRTVEVREKDGIYINGQKVKFKGVCRHSFWPESGRTTSKDISIKDVQLMKDMNMNAVRMSHYPPDRHFLDVCDSLGMFVLDELAGWQSAYDTGIGQKLVKEMVIRDVNHPSVILWDNGNEGGWNYDLDDDFQKYDPQKRIVIHPWEKFGLTDTNHYIDYNYGNNDSFNGNHIFFPTEFLHGLYDGGLGAGLEDYWNLMWSKPRAAGGFLWVFSDEAVLRMDKNGELDSDGNHAPDGIVGPYREKEGSYYAIKDIWSPIQFQDKIITSSFNGEFAIENRFHFTNLQNCFFLYELANFANPHDHTTGYESMKFGQIKSPDLEPGQTGIIKIDLPDNWADADVLYIKAIDPHNREIYTWDWPVILPRNQIDGYIADEEFPAPEIIEGDDVIILIANNIKVSIDKKSGGLDEVSSGDMLIPLTNGPQMSEGDGQLVTLNAKHDQKKAVVSGRFKGNLKEIKWIMHPNGILQLLFRYTPNNHQPYYGFNFDFPEDAILGVRYLGKGPYRVWKNRMRGNTLNIWHKKYNNTSTGESYIYPEFKGYHANLYWAEIENRVKDFVVVSASENLFLRLFTPEKHVGDERNTAMNFPEGDISFLQAIPAIGTKFKRADQLGPQSQLNQFSRHWTDNTLEIELLFDFR